MEEYAYYLDSEELCTLVRAEATMEEIAEQDEVFVYSESRYDTTLEDLFAAMGNLYRKGVTYRQFTNDWFVPIYHTFFTHLNILGVEGMTKKGVKKAQITYDKDTDWAFFIINWCRRMYGRYKEKRVSPDAKLDFTEVKDAIGYYYSNKEVPLSARKYTDYMMVLLLYNVGYPSAIDKESAKVAKLYNKFVNALMEHGHPDAFRVAAFSYFDGNKAFEKDYAKAEEMFLKLYNMTEDPTAANYLGDIYYNGYVGEPSFKKAFDYYTVAALCGEDDARCKVADMYTMGRGVVRSDRAARSIILALFEDTYEDFCMGDFACRFADAAARVGNVFNSGIGVEKNPNEALKFYNIARYAIKKRMATTISAGDALLLKTIEDSIAKLKEKIGTDRKAMFNFSNIPTMLASNLGEGYDVSMTIEKNGKEYCITSRRIPKNPGEKVMGTLIEFPLLEYCNLTWEGKDYFGGSPKIWTKNKKKTVLIDAMNCDAVEGWEFRYRDELVATIKNVNIFTVKLENRDQIE